MKDETKAYIDEQIDQLREDLKANLEHWGEKIAKAANKSAGGLAEKYAARLEIADALVGEFDARINKQADMLEQLDRRLTALDDPLARDDWQDHAAGPPPTENPLADWPPGLKFTSYDQCEYSNPDGRCVRMLGHDGVHVVGVNPTTELLDGVRAIDAALNEDTPTEPLRPGEQLLATGSEVIGGREIKWGGRKPWWRRLLGR